MRRNAMRSSDRTTAAAGLWAAGLLGMLVAPPAPLTAAPAVTRVAPAVPAPPAAAATDSSDASASQAYQTLFGAEEKRVRATTTPKDDGQFANKLMEKSKSLTDDPALLRMVYAKAYEFGIKDPEGYTAAAQALAKLGECNAMPKMELQDRQLELARLRLKRGNTTDRAEAGNWLIDELTGEGDRFAGLHDYAEALKRYTEAAAVASQVGSPRVDEVRGRVKNLQARMATRERLNKLVAQFEARPGDSKLAGQIVTGFLLDLDDPAEASKLPPSILAGETRLSVVLAAKDPQSLTEDDHLKLARWYRSLAADKAVSAAGRATALARAQGYYLAFLGDHEKQDANRLAVTDELAGVTRQMTTLDGPSPTADRIVLWNTHNAQHNNAGATLVNVVLSLRGTPAWRRDNIPFPWEADRDTSLTLPCPRTAFDEVRVEVVRWRGECAGLSEVEVWRGDDNLVQGAAVRVSSAFDPIFPAAAITDKVTNSSAYAKGYWLAAAKQPAWAEVRVRPEPRKPAAGAVR
jgi:hypothetical protein